MDFSPLYFHLSVVAERLFANPEATLVWLQIALASASVALVFGLLERRVSVTLAAAAAAAMALDRHLLVYARVLEPEVVLLFCLSAFLALVERPSARAAWLAGGFAALCLAVRPTFLPAFVLVPLYLRWRGDRGGPWWRRSLGFAAPVGGALVLLALRSVSITSDPWTPAMNPGTVFFEGNNPLSHGTSAIYPPVVLGYVRHTGEVPDAAHKYYRDVARADSGRELSIGDVNAFWSRRALDFIRDEPGRFVRLLGDKLARGFHGFRWHDVPLAWRLDQLLFFVPAVPFALLSALAIAGALIEARRWRASLLYYALGISQLAVMLAFYVSARQRLVLLPALVYFAAVTLDRLAGGRPRKWPWWLLVAVLAVTLSLPDDATRDESYRRRASFETERLLDEVRAMSREQPLALHAGLAVEAVASAPWWLDWLRPAYFPRDEGTLEERVAGLLASRRGGGVAADFDLAAVRLEAGQVTEARHLLEPLAETGRAVYRGARQPSEPLVLLARAAALEGDSQGAAALLERALERSPGDPFALAELIALTDDPAWEEPLGRYWSHLDAQYLLGQALLRHGRPEDAARAFGFVVRRLPDFRDARVLFAAALGASGHLEEGARQYLEATRLRIEPILASDRIVDLFRRWAAEHAGDAAVQVYVAQVLHQHGHFREALAMLETLEPAAGLANTVEKEKEAILRVLGVGDGGRPG